MAERSCLVKVELGGYVVRLAITFPSHYPNGAAPSFSIDKSTTIDNITQGELVKVGAWQCGHMTSGGVAVWSHDCHGGVTLLSHDCHGGVTLLSRDCHGGCGIVVR